MVTKKNELDWNVLFSSTWKAFPEIWWRILIVNLLTFTFILLGSAIIVGIDMLLFGGFNESVNVFENLAMTGYITVPNIIIFSVSFLILILFIATIGIIGKISNILIVKNYTKKKKINPSIIFFKKSWHYFWRYGILSLRVLWYIVWPVILVAFLFGIIYGMSLELLNIVFTKSWLFLFIPVFLIILGFMIYRSLNAFLAQFYLIEKDTTVKKSFEKSLFLLKGYWWKIFGVLLLTSFLISILPSMILGFLGGQYPVDVIAKQNYNLSIFDIIFNIYSFIIITPFMISFIYFLMLYVLKLKKIK